MKRNEFLNNTKYQKDLCLSNKYISKSQLRNQWKNIRCMITLVCAIYLKNLKGKTVGTKLHASQSNNKLQTSYPCFLWSEHIQILCYSHQLFSIFELIQMYIVSINLLNQHNHRLCSFCMCTYSQATVITNEGHIDIKGSLR